MINLSAFLSDLKSIVSERPTYRNGGSATDGTCDCIGLIIGAIRRAGGTWSGTHGSNWAARNAMRGLHDLYSMDLGEVVYKAREPGEAGYDLPGAYLADPDVRDYYHAGVITSVAPLQITHCTSGGGANGIKTDSAIGNWKWGGKLKMVDYEDEDVADEPDDPDLLWTTAPSGRSVNLRSKPSKDGLVMARVPIDTEVHVLSASGDWRHVAYLGKTGWIMASYLTDLPPFTVDDVEPVELHIINLEGLIDWLRELQAEGKTHI